MSGFAAGQYTDAAEIERQLQEEFRRRQALAAAPDAALTALAGRAAVGTDYASHLRMLGVDAASAPYYARPGAPTPAAAGGAAGAAASTPYARVGGNPYAALDPTQARALYGGKDGAAAGSPLAELYGQHSKNAALQQAVVANYAAAAAYGAPTPTSAPPAYAYAMPPAPPSAAAAYPPPSGPPKAPPPPPNISEQAAKEIAIMQEAYARERENALKRQQGLSYTITPARVLSKPKATTSALTVRPNNKPATLGKVTSPIPGKKKDTAVLGKDKEGKMIVEDRGSTWYMGCVPLGVDDDKYWLSDLQVYLRANFAEAFAATEEDIAAPMHGRNKPIALGQVGIRCMHCKRKSGSMSICLRLAGLLTDSRFQRTTRLNVVSKRHRIRA